MRAQRRQVASPNAQEGVGNALRAAFTATHWAIPDDMRELLERIDR